MKNFLVIGNPIEHSLSPELHNYWIKKNNISAIYNKEKLDIEDLEKLVLKIKEKKIHGVNVTVPFKKEIISHLDELTLESQSTQSVNTIYFNNNKTIGHNTDIDGFENAIKAIKFEISKKRILILGAGGVAPSLVFALNRMKASQIILCNRTKIKAENLKNLFKNTIVLDWGEVPDFDMIINATSLGLNSEDKINLDFSKIGKNKFFYDVIYNPRETSFLKTGKNLGSKIENGKKMFLYQAAAAFEIWHGIKPEINEEVNKILD
jgi:shikimate dehydrogenase